MKLKYVAIGALAVLVLGRCGSDPALEQAEPKPPEQAAVSDPDATPKTSKAESRRQREAKPPRSAPSSGGPSSTGPASAAGTTLAALTLLAVKGRAPLTGYDRDRFGPAWLDADRNGCDTRNDVLGEYLRSITLESNGCVVATGVYDDPYTGVRIDYRQGHGALIDIDHVVPLANAWVTGAFGWQIKRRAALANDPLNLLPTDAGANRQKGDGDAATWLPPSRGFRCRYVSRQVAVKDKYDLWVTAPERAAIERVLASCPSQVLTPDTWGAATAVDHDISDPADSRRDRVPAPAPAAPVAGDDAVYFRNCDAARAAGAAPVRRGDPGYGSHLDRDGDGSGCE